MDQYKGFFTKDDEGPADAPRLTVLWIAVGVVVVVLLVVWIGPW